jgi:metal-responsive CopG/Arc/MetJ family transcriptional regulator
VKFSITLDEALVSAVDAYIANNPGTDRSAVIDDALRLWAERQQEHAMERQLREDLSVSGPELAAWRRVRRAALPRR